MSRWSEVILCVLCLSALSLSSGFAGTPQIVDATATLFPSQPAGEWSNQVTVGDLDGDGDLDIVFANGGDFSTPGVDQKVRIYINLGVGGRFKDQTDARTGGHAGIYRGAELGDCDNDGDLDILLAQDFDRMPGLLINNGTGFFTSEGNTRLPILGLSSSRGQFADVDNDGDLDIFLPSGLGTRFGCGQYRLYLNDGTCNYTDATATNFPQENICNNMDAIFGDIDNDFDLDLRTASTGNNNSRLYRNDGTGVFSVVSGVPADSTCYSYDFGDIDNDGDLDMLGANALNGSAAELLLENDGTGAFTNISSQISPNPSQDDNDSKFFDYDNDGDLDLIIARLNGAEKVYRNLGLGNFTQELNVIEAISDSSLDVAVADVDNDGDLDVITAQGESGDYTNRLYINEGPADTRAPRVIDTESLADTSDTVGPYVVRGLVLDDMSSDRNFFDGGIFLTHVVDGNQQPPIPMRYSGGQVYRGEIPGRPAGSVILYSISANDFAGNGGAGVLRSFSILGGPAAAGEVPETSLIVDKGVGAEVALSWDASCAAGDNDYAIYEGTIGLFTTHAMVQCSTGGATSVGFVPAVGSSYYLVVPRNGAREGSYGRDGDGAERPAAGSACLIQLTGDCP